MIKKLPLLLLLSVFIVKAEAQQAAYNLPVPKGWKVEKMVFPISFAPKIPFNGVEELRFMPGWGDVKSNEYWSYAFLWYVAGQQKVNKDALESYLAQYFDGLYLSNLKKGTIAPPAGFTKVHVKKSKAEIVDKQTFEAGINTLNFLTGQPVKFNVRIHIRDYAPKDHTALLFEISPQPYKNAVWDRLDAVVNGFQVNNQH